MEVGVDQTLKDRNVEINNPCLSWLKFNPVNAGPHCVDVRHEVGLDRSVLPAKVDEIPTFLPVSGPPV